MNTENKKTGHRQVIFYITEGGRRLAKKIADGFPGSKILKYNSKSFAAKWAHSKNIICIMATGIVVRAVAQLVKDKRTDPAVVVLDEKGQYAISFLSGHVGSANKLAEDIAGYLDAQAVITTASDVQGKVALDIWAAERGLYAEDPERLKKISVRIVNGKKVKVKIDGACNSIKLPCEFIPVDTVKEAHMIISPRTYKKEVLYLRPKVLCAGIGCNRGTTKKEIGEVVGSVFESAGLSLRSISALASIDLKKDEKGLIAFARDNGFEIEFYGKDELNRTAEEHNIKGSAAVQAATGAVAVAEPAALLAAKRISGKFSVIIPKEKRGNVTLAITQAELAL